MPRPKRPADSVDEATPSKKAKPNAPENGAIPEEPQGSSPRKRKAVKRELLPAEERGKGSRQAKTPSAPAENGGDGDKVAKEPKGGKSANTMPLAVRSTGLRMFVGAHVSAAGGVQNSVENASNIGGNSFALFLKSQRKWANPPLKDEHRDQFRKLSQDSGYDAAKHVLPHGSYLVNLAQYEADKATQAYDSFVDDLKRCEALGVQLYNFHPGNTGSRPRPDAIARIAGAINRAHKATRTVIPVLENMAGSGNVVGSTFEDLRDMIGLIEDKSRVGVCIDTCHTFAAGYDLRTPEAFQATLENFDKVVGMRYLRALHLNDSKAPLGSHRDLHQNIGLGFLGLRTFHSIMNEKRFEDLPMVLETPIDHKDANGRSVEDKSIWAKEIKLLESLIGMDAEGAEFKKLEKELSAKGAVEREKLQDQADRKAEKENKSRKGGKGAARKRKKQESTEPENDDENI